MLCLRDKELTWYADLLILASCVYCMRSPTSIWWSLSIVYPLENFYACHLQCRNIRNVPFRNIVCLVYDILIFHCAVRYNFWIWLILPMSNLMLFVNNPWVNLSKWQDKLIYYNLFSLNLLTLASYNIYLYLHIILSIITWYQFP